jgi:hypothetical protein
MNNLTNQEGRRIGWLLTEIENQTQGQLSDEARQNLIAEVASHLDTSIRARIDAGMNPLDAEIDAVKSFGPPNDYLTDLLDVHSQGKARTPRLFRGDRALAISYLLLTLSLMTCLLSGIRDNTMTMLMVIAAIFGSAFAFFSFLSRRIQLIPLAGASIAATVIFMVAATIFWTNLNVYGGMGVVPNWQIASIRAENQRQIRILRPIVATLEAGVSLHSRYLTESKLASLNPEQQKLAMSIPEDVGLPTFNHWRVASDARLVLKPAKSLTQANYAWDSGGHQLLYNLEPRLDSSEQYIAVTSHLGPKRYLAELGFNFWQNMVAFPAWFGFTFVINFIFGGLGILTSRFSISRRARTA